MMIVSSQASHIYRTNSTFRLSASQYVQSLGEPGKLPLSITIPDTTRFKKVKPLPLSDGSNAATATTLNSQASLNSSTSSLRTWRTSLAVQLSISSPVCIAFSSLSASRVLLTHFQIYKQHHQVLLKVPTGDCN